MDRGNAARVIQRTGSNSNQGSVNTGMVMLPLKDWGERPDSSTQIVQRLPRAHAGNPGARVTPITPGGLGGTDKPVQLVLQGPEYAPLARVAERVIAAAGSNPGLTNLEMDYEERQPQLQVRVDRNKAADLGVSLVNVGSALETMLGSRVVTTFQKRRRPVQRGAAGPRRAARLCGRPRQHLRALQQIRRTGAAGERGGDHRRQCGFAAAAFQPHALGDRVGEPVRGLCTGAMHWNIW